jgi:hypothetical protein
MNQLIAKCERCHSNCQQVSKLKWLADTKLHLKRSRVHVKDAVCAISVGGSVTLCLHEQHVRRSEGSARGSEEGNVGERRRVNLAQWGRDCAVQKG